MGVILVAVGKDDREPRPPDSEYYAHRTAWVRQGDLFSDVPVLAFPFPPQAIDHSEGKRKFLAGPFDSGFAMPITPTCTMAAQGVEAGKYAHPLRALAPVISIEEMVERGFIKADSVPLLRSDDRLANYFYVPEISEHQLPESVALLYAPMVIHHEFLEGRRIAQLSVAAAAHLKRQLALHVSGELFNHDDFVD